MKRLLALLVCLSLLPLNVPLVRGDDTDIFGANIEPNILIFIDNSGSMDDYIDQASEAAYNPATTYTTSGSGLPKVNAKVYRCKSGYSIDDCENDPSLYVVYTDTVAQVNSATARTSLNANGTWNGKISGSSLQLRTGNYLNYHFSPTGGHEKKITVAQRVLTNLVNHTEGVRFGLAKFTGNGSQGPGGAQIIADVGSTNSTLITALAGISPSGFTPLKGALYDMGKYYKGTYSGKTSPIQYECQPNYILMMTDGLQNGNGDMRDEATLRRTQDHSTTMPGTQNVMVDTIGFAIPASDADAANAELQTTATNGGGKFYSTTSEAQLESALEDSIRRIMAATFAFASPVIPTTSATGLARAYLAAFQSDPSRPFWRGYLKAYNRDSSGQVPTDTNGAPLDSALAWDAGQKLTEKAAADRTIYTLIGGTRQAFNKSNSNLTQALLGVSTSTDRDKTIDFIRGVDANDENGNGNTTEDRDWKLGDIFHATPVVVTPPFLPSTDASYIAFRTAQASRTTIVIAAANDGMLHAFRESDGVELWAFVPGNILGKLKDLMVAGANHPFLLDSSPVAADVKIGGNWKTIVVFGERRGGANYYALDITDTTDPQYLWSFTDSKIVETWSEPFIGKVKMNSSTGGTERYVAIFGGGYDTASNNAHGKALFVVDLSSGAKLWEYYNNSSTDDRQYMNFSIPANPLALDLDNDGYIDHVYIGDVGGQLWKFDLTSPATLTGGTTGTVNNWTGKRFFRAGTDTNPPAAGEYYPSQALYDAPDAAFDSNGKLWLYFGTGDRNHPNNTASNRFYGIKDDPYTNMTNGSVITEATTGMVDATTLTAVPTVGWYYQLSSTNKEKVLSSPSVYNKNVLFTTFSPSTTTACGNGGGTAKFYAVAMTTAFAAIDFANDQAYDTTHPTDATKDRGTAMGSGIPSTPRVSVYEVNTDTSGGTVVTTTGPGEATLSYSLFGTTDAHIHMPTVPGPTTMRRILYWREVF